MRSRLEVLRDLVAALTEIQEGSGEGFTALERMLFIGTQFSYLYTASLLAGSGRKTVTKTRRRKASSDQTRSSVEEEKEVRCKMVALFTFCTRGCVDVSQSAHPLPAL